MLDKLIDEIPNKDVSRLIKIRYNNYHNSRYSTYYDIKDGSFIITTQKDTDYS